MMVSYTFDDKDRTTEVCLDSQPDVLRLRISVGSGRTVNIDINASQSLIWKAMIDFSFRRIVE